MVLNDGRARVSIVIPVYNSEKSIGRLVRSLVEDLRKTYDLEIVLVNDCSKDNSEAACVELFRDFPDCVRLYLLAKNVGEHNAVMAGLNKAGGDYVIIMDDDFQNPVESVVKLLDHAVKSGADVTYSYYPRKKHSLLRNLGSALNDRIANVMLKKPRDLYLSSFKVLNRFLVNEIIKYRLPYPYLDGLVLRTTDRIARVEVPHRKRADGKSGYTLTKLIRLWSNMFTNFSILPLRVSFCLGFFVSLAGLIFGIVILLEKLSNPAIPMGYTSLVLVVLVFAGIQLMSLGLIGEYVGRIFLSQSKKPQFSIRESWEKGKTSEGLNSRQGSTDGGDGTQS